MQTNKQTVKVVWFHENYKHKKIRLQNKHTKKKHKKKLKKIKLKENKNHKVKFK